MEKFEAFRWMGEALTGLPSQIRGTLLKERQRRHVSFKARKSFSVIVVNEAKCEVRATQTAGVCFYVSES